MNVLAIDGGKTKTLVAPYLNGHRGEVIRFGGLENIAAPKGPDDIRRTLASGIDTVAEWGPWDGVAIGLTGVYAHTPQADVMLDILGELFDTPQLAVASDVVTTYCGALGLQPGAVVAAGTGSVALGLAEGRFVRVDGWGYLVGDEGSGFAIGRAGLRAVFRELDGRGGSPALVELARQRFGSTDAITPKIYGSSLPPAAVAAFSAEVSRAALDGDEVSQRIWAEAAEALAEMVVTAAQQVTEQDDAVRISWSGGLFEAEPLLRRPFLTAVQRRLPRATVHDPLGDALDGAALLATGNQAPLLAPVVTRRAAPKPIGERP